MSAHATSTPAGDAAEAAGLGAVFGAGAAARPPAVSAVKSALGHLLGAAGAVEAALTVLALHHGRAPPTAALGQVGVVAPGVGFVRGAPGGAPLDPSGRGVALSNSFGFGGGNVCLAFGRAGEGGRREA